MLIQATDATIALVDATIALVLDPVEARALYQALPVVLDNSTLAQIERALADFVDGE